MKAPNRDFPGGLIPLRDPVPTFPRGVSSLSENLGAPVAEASNIARKKIRPQFKWKAKRWISFELEAKPKYHLKRNISEQVRKRQLARTKQIAKYILRHRSNQSKYTYQSPSNSYFLHCIAHLPRAHPNQGAFMGADNKMGHMAFEKRRYSSHQVTHR